MIRVRSQIEQLHAFETDLGEFFKSLVSITESIRQYIQKHTKRKLKGDEIVGWLGEVYAKFLVDGEVEIDDSLDYDVTAPSMRISVKARKGTQRNWNRTSSIPSNELSQENGPTHLLFLQLNDDYRLKRAWLYDWNQVQPYFKPVKAGSSMYYFKVKIERDRECLIYPIQKQTS